MSNLRSHVRGVHQQEKRYSCDYCEKKYFFKSELLKHVDNMHEKKTKFKCEKCDKSFTHRQSLKKHNYEMHDGTKSYQCSKCDKSFNRNLYTVWNQMCSRTSFFLEYLFPIYQVKILFFYSVEYCPT